MNYINQLQKQKNNLENQLNWTLYTSILRTNHRCLKQNNKPEEPDYLADLVINWTKDLVDTLNIFLGKQANFEATSIFCHKRPIVDFGKNKGAELGDLLIVFCHTDKSNKKFFNSLLLQAKVTNNTSATVDSSDLHQLDLYQGWPEFTYRFNYKIFKSLNERVRDIYPKTINSGAQYLMITDTNPNYYHHSCFSCATPNKTLIASTDFVEQILNLLQFQTGRTFDDRNNINDDWTKMIWDLIDMSKNVVSNCKNSGRKKFSRQSQTAKLNGSFYLSNLDTSSYFKELISLYTHEQDDGNNDKIFNSERGDYDDSSVSIIFLESIEDKDK